MFTLIYVFCKNILCKPTLVRKRRQFTETILFGHHKHCLICTEQKYSYEIQCCSMKNSPKDICKDCLGQLNEKCPFCRKELIYSENQWDYYYISVFMLIAIFIVLSIVFFNYLRILY